MSDQSPYPWCRAGEDLRGRAVPIDLELGCPNRKPDGRGGCTFCAGDGGRARQILEADGIAEQVERGIAFARERYGARRFLAYVQAFTGTYAQPRRLKELLDALLACATFDALSVGTRPDCLPDPILDTICGFRNRLPVWVDLGIQTVHDRTLRRVRRGHTWEQSRAAIPRLHERGILIAAHVILGLPGETRDDFNRTADALAEMPIQAIKMHNLHVLKGTSLAQEYARAPFPVFDEFQYAEHLIEFLQRLPLCLPVLRLQTDSPEQDLLAPRWAMTKGHFLDFLAEEMRLRDVRQGDRCAVPATVRRGAPAPPPTWCRVGTDDGSVTLWNPEFKEHYHAPVGAYSEAMGKYVLPSGLPERLAAGPVRLLDICFGMGYNTLAACETAVQCPGSATLDVVALERDRRAVTAAARVFADTPPAETPLNWAEVLTCLLETGRWQHARVSIRIHWGDARYTLRTVTGAEPFHVAFLDPFSTQRNSELWTVDFFRQVRDALNETGRLLTYCTAVPVCSGLERAGFHVGRTHRVPPHRPATLAAVRPADVDVPLPGDVRLAMKTHRGIPYRDPHGVDANRQILRRRELEIEAAKRGPATPAAH